MQDPISIIIPTYKSVEYLSLCLESIYKNQSNSQNQVVIVVDGTLNIVKSALETYKNLLNLKVIVFAENKGLAVSSNYGFYSATNKLCLNINDDNVCPKDFDFILTEVYYKFNHLRKTYITPNQIEPKSSIFKPFIIHDFGKDVNEFDLAKFTKEEQQFRHSQRSIGWTFPFFIEKEMFLSTGGFDPMFESGHVIDWELFIKLDKMGAAGIRTSECNFYHFGQKSSRTPESYQKEAEAHKYFEMKWGFPAYNKLLQ